MPDAEMGVEKYTTASFKFNFLFLKSFKTHSLGCTQPSTRCGRPGAPKSACCSAGCTSARFSWPWPAYRMDTYHCHEFIRTLPRVLVAARVVTAHVFHGLTLHTEWRPIFVCVLPRVPYCSAGCFSASFSFFHGLSYWPP